MGLNKESMNVKAEMIIEVIGRPPEHLIETLDGMIERIEDEKGVTVLRKKINESQPMKDNPEFYTTFAEIEVEVEEVLYLVMLVFKYMPAHIEIISPEKISLSNNGWNEIVNEVARRLHGYDEIARVLEVEKSLLERKLREILDQKKENQVKSEVPLEDKSEKKKADKKNKK